MGGRDYIPGSDVEFDAWLKKFTAYVVAHFAALGISAADKDILVAKLNGWSAKYGAHIAAEDAFHGTTDVKADAQKDAEAFARKLAQQTTAHGGTTDIDREAMGLTVRDTVPTKVGIPEIAPELEIDFSQRLQHKVHAGINPQNEQLNKKPKGVASIELRKKVDEAPTGPDDMQIAAIITNSPAVIDLEGQAGKTIYYVARYLNTKGQPGPWGEVESAEVTGI